MEAVDLDDERALQEVGIYRYHHPLENADAFKARLLDLQERIKETIKGGEAIDTSEMFTFNNSLAKSRKMTGDLSKLMLRAYNAEAGAAELEAKLAGLDEAIAQNDYRAANIRAGYVYVISNRGAFGRRVVKIGLTRRLEPMDRVRELGDASVPFPFDVHALFFSEDAVTLENELHHAFADRRVNVVNQRCEFFFATPEQVREVLTEKVGSLLEYTDDPESTQFLQSEASWPAEVST